MLHGRVGVEEGGVRQGGGDRRSQSAPIGPQDHWAVTGEEEEEEEVESFNRDELGGRLFLEGGRGLCVLPGWRNFKRKIQLW